MSESIPVEMAIQDMTVQDADVFERTDAKVMLKALADVMLVEINLLRLALDLPLRSPPQLIDSLEERL